MLKPQRRGVDAVCMRSLLRLALPVYVFAAALCGQERHATVKLDGGVTLEGAIVAMDLEHLELRTADGLVSIPSGRIRRFAYLDASGEPEPAAPRRAVGGSPPPPDVDEPQGEGDYLADAAIDSAMPLGEGARTAPARAIRGSSAPHALGVESDGDAEPPFDLRHTSRFAARVALLDARYPWLVPAVPMQWASLGLALFALLSLAIQSAIKVAAGESPEFSRSVRLAAVYLLAAGAQFSFVPVNDFAMVVTLLANPAVVLFLHCRWFGLGRIAALLALAVQLGFLVLGFGALELVDALLASIGAPGR